MKRSTLQDVTCSEGCDNVAYSNRNFQKWHALGQTSIYLATVSYYKMAFKFLASLTNLSYTKISCRTEALSVNFG